MEVTCTSEASASILEDRTLLRRYVVVTGRQDRSSSLPTEPSRLLSISGVNTESEN
jgi:hypothetical protein